MSHEFMAGAHKVRITDLYVTETYGEVLEYSDVGGVNERLIRRARDRMEPMWGQRSTVLLDPYAEGAQLLVALNEHLRTTHLPGWLVFAWLVSDWRRSSEMFGTHLIVGFFTQDVFLEPINQVIARRASLVSWEDFAEITTPNHSSTGGNSMAKLNHQRPELVVRDNYERELRRSLGVLATHAADAPASSRASPRFRVDALGVDELGLIVALMEAVERSIELQASVFETFADAMKRKKGGRPAKRYATSEQRDQAFEHVEDTLADYLAMAMLMDRAAETTATKRQRDALLGAIFNDPFLAVRELLDEPTDRMWQRIFSRLSEHQRAS